MVCTAGSVAPNSPSSASGNATNIKPDAGGHAKPDARRGVHALHGALGMAGAEVLSGDRRRRAHQAHRRPGDQREQLGVADRVRGLRLGALRRASR